MSEEGKSIERDVQIHIHEHVAPLRERVGKIEGQIEAHAREINMLRQSLDGLRDRVDGVRTTLLASMEKAHAELIDAMRHHSEQDMAKDDEISRKVSKVGEAQALCAERLASLRSWIVGIGIGAGLLIAGIQLFYKIHGGP